MCNARKTREGRGGGGGGHRNFQAFYKVQETGPESMTGKKEEREGTKGVQKRRGGLVDGHESGSRWGA